MSSPYPARKRRSRAKGSGDKPNHQDYEVSEQVDAFVADVIENAKKEYLAEIQNDTSQTYTGNAIDNSNSVHHDGNDSRCTVFDDSMKISGDQNSSRGLRFMEDGHTSEKRSKSRLEANEDNPLLEKDISRRKGLCRRMCMRLIGIITCWHCTCLRDVYEIT